MRKLSFCLFVLATSAGRAHAAGCDLLVLPDDGTSSGNARAPVAKFEYSRVVYIITPQEMSAAGFLGPLTAIGWSYFTAPGVTGTAPLKIYLQNTNDTTLTKSTVWANVINGMTLVHDVATTLPNVVGDFKITFSGGSTFNYTGGGLYVAFDWGFYGGPKSTTVATSTTTTLPASLLSQSSTGAPPPTVPLVSNFRPETFFTGFVPKQDVRILHVIAMGAIPLGVAPGSQTIKATVFQLGDTDLTDIPITLDIDGAEPSTQTIVVPNLGACASIGQAITFDPFTPSVIGPNTLTVSTAEDENPANDVLVRPLDVTSNTWSYERAGVPPDGGFGFTSPGSLVAKFTVASTQVDAISVNFKAPSATTYRLEIYADNGTGKPGGLLYLDAANRSVTVAGKQTIKLPAPVPVAGNFFVGVRQTNTQNMQYAVNDELPVRVGTFFYNGTPGSTAWVDFALDNLFSQLNIGVIVGDCLRPLVVDVTPDKASVCPGAGIELTANPTGSAPYTYQWTEDGANIPGATGSTYTPTKATAQSHTYNCRVIDSGGCDTTDDDTATAVTWEIGTAPGETAGGAGRANQLVWTGPDVVAWPVNPDAASYTLYRGVGADLPKLLDASVDSCTRYQGAAATATGLDEVPASTQFYWYVVTGSSACQLEGPAGNSRVVNSSGVCP